MEDGANGSSFDISTELGVNIVTMDEIAVSIIGGWLMSSTDIKVDSELS